MANTGSGNDPGNMNFVPFGQPFVDPSGTIFSKDGQVYWKVGNIESIVGRINPNGNGNVIINRELGGGEVSVGSLEAAAARNSVQAITQMQRVSLAGTARRIQGAASEGIYGRIYGRSSNIGAVPRASNPNADAQQAGREAIATSGNMLRQVSLQAGVGIALGGLGNIGSHGPVDATTLLNGALRWLGTGYREIAPGVYQNGLRRFRMTGLGGRNPYVNFEALNSAGAVIENLHVPVAP